MISRASKFDLTSYSEVPAAAPSGALGPYNLAQCGARPQLGAAEAAPSGLMVVCVSEQERCFRLGFKERRQPVSAAAIGGMVRGNCISVSIDDVFVFASKLRPLPSFSYVYY